MSRDTIESRLNGTDGASASRIALVCADMANVPGHIAAALEGIGLAVRGYTGADDALKELAGLDVAVIVLDSNDDAKARTLCRKLRHQPLLRDVPIILLGKDDGREALNDDYEAGATNVFIKPCTEEFLSKRLRCYGSKTDTHRTSDSATDSAEEQAPGLPDVIFEVDASGLVLKCVASGNDDGTLQPRAMLGRKVAELLSHEVSLLFQSRIRRALKSRKNEEFPVSIGHDDDARRYSIRLIVRGRDRLLAVFREQNDNDSKRLFQTRRWCDTLTGLTTRELFFAEVDVAISDARLRESHLAVIAVDLDRFTQINESLGRRAGDSVLRESSERIHKVMQESGYSTADGSKSAGTPLSRIGGDEFILMLRDVKSRDAVQEATRRIREAFDAPMMLGDASLLVTPSIGASIFPSDGVDSETLCENARAALDEARFEGIDNSKFYTDTMKFRTLERPDVIKELGWAIENDQLEVHYLPRFDLASGVVTGMEALLRWMHPLRGSVPLSDVIPIAEVSGLIGPLGEWILDAACAEASRWSQERPTAPCVSINLSRDEFSRRDLPQLVQKALASHALDPGRLQLEVPEKLLLRHRRSHGIVKELRSLGVRIVIDDFGVGHSSLTLLSEMPIDAIKIDRSLVEGSGSAAGQGAVCAAIIAMAHELGISVIAVGVETVQQRAFLTGKGCDAVQGFLYSRPLPAADVLKFLDSASGSGSGTKVTSIDRARSGSG